MGSTTSIVLLHEVVDDVPLELLLEVQEVVGYADLVTHPAGVLNVLNGAASLLRRGDVVPFDRPQPHRDSDDVVALPMQQQRGDRRVDSSAHCHDYLALAHESKPSTASFGRSIDRDFRRQI